MSDLHTLIAGKAALEKIIERYKAKLDMAAQELEHINIALSILQKYGVAPDVSASEIRPQTVADMAVEILKEHPEGLTANQILEIIHSRWMPELMRSSLSPPLSRLKHMGMVKLEDQLWKLHHSSRRESLFERITQGVLLSENENTDENDLFHTSDYRRRRKVAS